MKPNAVKAVSPKRTPVSGFRTSPLAPPYYLGRPACAWISRSAGEEQRHPNRRPGPPIAADGGLTIKWRHPEAAAVAERQMG